MILKFVFVINCRRRCSRYYLHGEKKGYIDVFAKNLPGLPDNVRYDGDGHYWMALPWVIWLLNNMLFLATIQFSSCDKFSIYMQDNSLLFTYTQKYQFVRKIFAFTLKHLRKMPDLMKFGGVIVLDLEGKVVGGYYDETWGMTSSGVKIGESLYLGSVTKPYITRLNLTQHPLRLIS